MSVCVCVHIWINRYNTLYPRSVVTEIPFAYCRSQNKRRVGITAFAYVNNFSGLHNRSINLGYSTEKAE